MEIKSTKGLHADKVKMLIYGDAGKGKTTFLGTGDNDKTVIISAESGLLCLGDKDIDVIEIKSFQEMREALRYIYRKENADKYNTIAVDSLSEIAEILVKELQANPEYKDPKNIFKLWAEYNDTMITMIKAIRDLDKNVVFTALVEETSDGGMITKKPYIPGSKAQLKLPSLFDEVFFIETDPATETPYLQTRSSNLAKAKDRSGKLEPTEKPDLSIIIAKIRGEYQTTEEDAA